MSVQFDLGTKYLEYRKKTQEAIADIKFSDPKKAIKELYKKSYGYLPSEKSAYDDYLGLIVCLEEIAKVSPETAFIMTDQILTQKLLLKYGLKYGINNAKNSFNTGDLYAVLCAEPALGTLKDMATTAVKKSDKSWHLSGKKIIRKEQLDADKFIIFARDEEAKIRIFNVSDGKIKINTTEKSFAAGNLHINHAEFNLDVDDNQNVAFINDNFERYLSIARTMIAAVALGISYSSLIPAVETVKTVKDVNNQAVSNSQSAQFSLADLFAEMEAARMLTYLSADCVDKNIHNIKYATMAKVQATNAAAQISTGALQLIGNFGYTTNDDFADIINSAISSQIRGGTNRVQKNRIYEYMLAKK